MDCSNWVFDINNNTGVCRNLTFISYCEEPFPDTPSIHYSDINAVWVLTAAIIVFFMKAGFMLVEVSFASTPSDRRHVIILKHQDAFASAFGFFLFGFDMISRYHTPYHRPDFAFYVTEPGLWFFKFTFASNAATIVGGCLITNVYKMRIPAAFVSAFVISAFIHPVVALLIWSDGKDTFSPYKFCDYKEFNNTYSWVKHCTDTSFSNTNRWYVLDFAGGGAVHGIGGIVGLVLCLFVKLQEWRDKRRNEYERIRPGAEPRDVAEKTNFWKWMYPDNGGDEATVEAALGVLILWFCWFAFNCGSTENMEGISPANASKNNTTPYYRISGIVAVNMVMAGASGGVVAVSIAVWAQLRYRTESVNANEIANGILSALVSITAGCAFVDYWGAVLIGAIGVIVYHLGSLLEYKLGIEDTARVFPVHGLCGLWSMIAIGLFTFEIGECNLHNTYEHTCHCSLRLPRLGYFERLFFQIFGAFLVFIISIIGSVIMFLPLYLIPVKPVAFVCERIFFLNYKKQYKSLHDIYRGNMLFTTPQENDISIRKDFENQPLTNVEDGDKDSHTNALNLKETGDSKPREHYGSVVGHPSMRNRIPPSPQVTLTEEVSGQTEV